MYIFAMSNDNGRGRYREIKDNKAMKRFIASFQNAKGECWDSVIYSGCYKDALREARKMQKEMGKLYSVRLDK